MEILSARNIDPVTLHETVKVWGFIPKFSAYEETKGTYLEAVEEFTLAPGVRAEPHYHDTHEFFYILEGSAVIQIENEAHGAKGENASFWVFYNRPLSAALYEPVGQRLLPLDAQWQQGLAKVRWPTANLPEVMGGGTTTLRALIREYLFISLFRACAESLASENASRLAAIGARRQKHQ